MLLYGAPTPMHTVISEPTSRERGVMPDWRVA